MGQIVLPLTVEFFSLLVNKERHRQDNEITSDISPSRID